MTEQQKKLISIEYLLDIIKNLLNDKYPYDLSILKQISINAKEKHYNEVNDAFLKGMKHGGELKSTEPNSF
jgi:hypothetical protein